MSTRTEELVSEWESIPFDGGYAGLQSLADREFSGAVVAGPARLFMLKGTVVGILDGEIEDFEGADGTARQAPHEALPLLAVMQARADEPRAQYYTQETSMADVDRTLTDGNFTGFIELSENVLSGDYYLVYHQGRSMSVAWVGSSGKLITDDEAFEQANDEVGIYEVMPAEIEMIEIPEPESDTDTASPAASQSEEAGRDDIEDDEPTTDPAPSAESEPSRSETVDDVGTATDTESPSPAAAEPSAAESEVATDESATPSDDGVAATADTASQTNEETDTTTGNPSGPAAGGPPGSKAAGASQGSVSRGTAEESQSAQAQQTVTDEATEQEATAGGESQPSTTEPEPQSTETQAVEQPTTPDASTQGSPTTKESDATAGGSATTADLETRSIPSLDPERSVSGSSGADDSPIPQTSDSPSSPSSSPDATESQPKPDVSEPQSTAPESTESQPVEQTDTAVSTDELAELESELADADAEIDRLEQELSELSATNEELRSERDRLASELENAEAEIERLENQSDAGTETVAGGTRLSTTEAIDGTNLFVRYHSKGEATLDKAQQGEVDREAVSENIRLEYHTQFDADDATVDGTEFETFLHDSIQYRFVDWLISSLLYEIRDTGNGNAMSVLYQALPDIDRAELNGKVSVTYTEDGQEHRSQEAFDVVVRDRMGNPLVVANINDSREAATEGQMTDIVRNAERVGNASESLAAAFLVTSSFFEPGALETAEEATASGLFSRDKRKSFVNLSRKEGYHLCLLEARNNEFHLAVPEL